MEEVAEVEAKAEEEAEDYLSTILLLERKVYLQC